MPEPEALNDDDEVLNRQVPPGLWDVAEGAPMWTAFGPQSSDNGKMSTLRGNVTPSEAHRRHTEDHGLASVGTWGVRVGDAHDNGTTCIDDGGADGVPIDHASVDFNALTKAQRRISRRRLHELACLRGPLFEPPSSGSDREE